jgi:regulator of replication initiation timing
MAFEREIAMLQQHVEEIQDERSLQILQRAHELKRENEMLKMTLNQIAVFDDSQAEEEMDSAEEEYLRMKYYEALRIKQR